MQFSSRCELVGYVEREIAQALPSGWSSERTAEDSFVWQIVPGKRTTSAPLEHYRLWVTADWGLFVLEYGNSDAGWLSLNHVLLNAKVLDAGALDRFPLSEAIRHVISRCPPNEWGWT